VTAAAALWASTVSARVAGASWTSTVSARLTKSGDNKPLAGLDARLAIAALKSAIRERDPPKGCIHHSDRGSQFASADHRNLLTAHDLVGSMSRRGNPYDNAKAQSFMKTLKVEAVY
jgi:transposase InsO family protein